MVSLTAVLEYKNAHVAADADPSARCPAGASPAAELGHLASRATTTPDADHIAALLEQIPSPARGRVGAAFHAAMINHGLLRAGSAACTAPQRALVSVLLHATMVAAG